MTDEDLLDKASDLSLEKLTDAGDEMEKVPEPFRTVAIIHAAQGIIDNGGLQYFYENDWPHHPPYSLFADAYEKIGRIEAAQAIRDSANTFGLANPEMDADKRREYIEKHYDEEEGEVTGWNDCICGDERVWSDLASWIRRQSEFP